MVVSWEGLRLVVVPVVGGECTAVAPELAGPRRLAPAVWVSGRAVRAPLAWVVLSVVVLPLWPMRLGRPRGLGVGHLAVLLQVASGFAVSLLPPF